MPRHRYAALLRAVNVGGAGKLSMGELREACEVAGFRDARTYIASGNVVFTSSLGERAVASHLGSAVGTRMGKRVEVLVRNAAQLRQVIEANPFPDAAGNRLMVVFLAAAPAPETLTAVRKVTDERIALGEREVYVHYPSGVGRSKLVLPWSAEGTARNLNTVSALAELAAELP
ncbi:DUF1697 domain-containing protein [Ruicaihuangia caeni]|uniref:DUF1697 domain-containing protein n=1 Tax=Ruicaihuangia caeni TaxID=3042517 RepID=UPI0033906F21